MNSIAEQVNQPKILILIPNKNSTNVIKTCVESILQLTTYNNFEVVIIDNGSTDSDTLAYYESLSAEPKVCILPYPRKYNYQAMINYAAKNREGDYLLLMNNDIKLLTPNWLELLLDILSKDDAGAVGPKMYYPDMSLQHIGGTLYMHNKNDMVYDYMYIHLPKEAQDKIEILSQTRPVACITGACLMISRSLFEQVGGMDENFVSNFGDADLCMKIRALGKHPYVHPKVELIHYENASWRGKITADQIRRIKATEDYFFNKWRSSIPDKDPYDTNNEYRIKRGLLFSIQKILYKILPLNIYVYFHRLGSKLNMKSIEKSRR